MTRPLEALPPHGTRARYHHPRARCSCARCRRANADYVAAWRRSRTCRYGCSAAHVDPACPLHHPRLPLEVAG